MKFLKLLLEITVVAILFSFTNLSVGAAAYGDGKYGASIYSAQSNSAAGAPFCNDTPPGLKAPWLYEAIPGSTSILLYFTGATDPFDRYVLQFGTKSGDYPYGSTITANKNTRSYLVSSLSPNTTYYFRIRGGNGCATGPWSNEIFAETRSTSFGDRFLQELITSDAQAFDAGETASEASDERQDGQQQKIPQSIVIAAAAVLSVIAVLCLILLLIKTLRFKKHSA